MPVVPNIIRAAGFSFSIQSQSLYRRSRRPPTLLKASVGATISCSVHIEVLQYGTHLISRTKIEFESFLGVNIGKNRRKTEKEKEKEEYRLRKKERENEEGFV